MTMVFFLAAIANTLNAQQKEKKNTFGISLGGTASYITEYDATARYGAIGGLYWEYKLSDKFSLMTNILYAQRGEKSKNNFSDIKLGYLNSPLMVKYYVIEGLGVSTGVSLDLLLSVDGPNIDKDDFKKSDFSIPFGVSYDITNNFQLGMGYNIGLTDILENNPSNNKLKNSWGSISVTYIFK